MSDFAGGAVSCASKQYVGGGEDDLFSSICTLYDVLLLGMNLAVWCVVMYNGAHSGVKRMLKLAGCLLGYTMLKNDEGSLAFVGSAILFSPFPKFRNLGHSRDGRPIKQDISVLLCRRRLSFPSEKALKLRKIFTMIPSSNSSSFFVCYKTDMTK